MADQSKQATAQVRKILTEIQQATSSAAMATELGSRAVDSAVTQSNQAGEAITVLSAASSSLPMPRPRSPSLRNNSSPVSIKWPRPC